MSKGTITFQFHSSLPQEDTEEVLTHLYQLYKTEMSLHSGVVVLSENEYALFLRDRILSTPCLMARRESALCGVLFHSEWEEENALHCSVPLGGIIAESQEIAGELFRCLAEEIVREKKCVFHISLYAHEEALFRAFAYLQFGVQAVICEKKIESPCHFALEPLTIRKIGKEETERRWEEIWALTKGIVKHLSKSPVFYPGAEFTEEVYRDFFMDPETTLFCAFDKETLIGIIERNSEENRLIAPARRSANIGEVYVKPEYRGQGIAKALLAKAEADALESGITHLWVEHGTANREGSAFWDKTFSPYCIEMIRDIYPIV